VLKILEKGSLQEFEVCCFLGGLLFISRRIFLFFLSSAAAVLYYAERPGYTRCCAAMACARWRGVWSAAGGTGRDPSDNPSVGGSRNGLRLLSRTDLASAGRFGRPAANHWA
jgi:hypothetical protein